MMYNIQVYDHTDDKGNTRLTVADSGIIRMSKAKDYLTFQMFDGVNYLYLRPTEAPVWT